MYRGAQTFPSVPIPTLLSLCILSEFLPLFPTFESHFSAHGGLSQGAQVMLKQSYHWLFVSLGCEFS